MSSRKKNIWLLIVVVVMLLCCYQLAFKKTFLLKSEFDQLKNESLLFQNTPSSIVALEHRLKHYDSILYVNKVTEASEQNSLLKTINEFGVENELKVINFLEPHRVQKEDLAITTYECSVEGEYNDLIRLIQELENNPRFGDVSHVSFERVKEPRTRRTYLVVTFLITSFV